ncbi:MAG: hypothetical protein GC193_08255 [Cryomorphaceae bacterium]|nr:hypothetical protein [Cryomorphaceae bacterium]
MKRFTISLFSLFLACMVYGQGNLNITFDVALEGVSSGNTTIKIFKGNELLRTLSSVDNKIFNCALQGGCLYTAEVESNGMTSKRVAFDLYSMTISSELTTIHVPIGLKSELLTAGMNDNFSDFPITMYTFDGTSGQMEENIPYANSMNTLAYKTIQEASVRFEEVTYEQE